MSRIARNQLNTCFFHVIVQGINKEYIFKSNYYMSIYKKILKQKFRSSKAKILSYCIMNNHAHLLIYANDIQEMANTMQKVNTTYAIKYNYLAKRVGFVFRDRYFTQPIHNDLQLYKCISYIHHNPIKAGIVDDLSKYKFSSYNEFLTNPDLICKKSLEIIFNSNDKTMFLEIHKLSDFNEIKDVEENININDFVQRFKFENSCSIEDIKDNKILTAKLVKDLRSNTNATYKEIGKILEKSHETIRKIANQA